MLSLDSAGGILRELFVSESVAKVQSALIPGTNLDAMRVVGGTTRDLLLEQRDILAPDQDLDFATPIIPEKVEGLLNSANIKTIRKGRSFEHGTVIAVLPQKEKPDTYRQFEITSLRRDIKTDGRHAEVDFTEDWQEDSNRRDFSINALYGDSQGTIHDFHHGIGDLDERVVRFIGNREERIEEDALRILRFFRFSALVADTPLLPKSGWIDPNRWCMRAIQSKTHLIDRLSGERVWAELKKILSIPKDEIRNGTLKSMQTVGVLEAIHPCITEIEYEKRLGQFKYIYGDISFMPLIRLVTLLSQQGESLQVIADRLSLSREDSNLLETLSEPLIPPKADSKSPPKSKQFSEVEEHEIRFHRAFQEQGEDVARARICITAARRGILPGPYQYKEKTIPFPLTGDDVMRELGIEAGPMVGEVLEILKKIELLWFLGGRKADRQDCLEYLRKEFGSK